MARNAVNHFLLSPPKCQYQGMRVSDSMSDCQHSETRPCACVLEKLETLKEVALLLGALPPKAQELRFRFCASVFTWNSVTVIWLIG